MDDEDELLLERASYMPMGGMHAGLLALHALSGLLFAAVMLLGPTIAPEVGDPLTTPRIYGAGVALFATALSVVFSSGLAIVVYRTVGLFPRWSVGQQRVAMFLGLGVAHVIGCCIGLAGVGAMITTTYLG